MSSEMFKISLARRIRVPLLDEQATCPLCGVGLDAFLDHALVCSCGGDRTLRHNSLRDTTFSEAIDAGMRAEREKADDPRPD